MAAKKPLVRMDVQWFEAQLPNGTVVPVRVTQEGYDAFKAIIARLVAGGL